MVHNMNNEAIDKGHLMCKNSAIWPIQESVQWHELRWGHLPISVPRGRNDFDIEMRIATASKIMGALKEYLKRTEVNIYSKYLIFMAIPINLLLLGCEC